MAVKVKDAASSATRFVARGTQAAGDYANGVRGAGQDWQQATAASAENYAAGVQDAIGRGAFAKGVQKVGGDKYSTRAAEVGARRFPEGIRMAEGDWSRETEPYLQTIRGLTLPPRRPKGDPGNIERVAAVATALRRRKLGG